MSVLVGKPAPDFIATAVVNGGKFDESFSLSQFRGKYVVLFFYPLDFTAVCPTEILAFQDKLGEFEKRNTQVIGVSVDSKYSHRAWLAMPRSQGGIQGVTYPIVADFSKTISANYDVLAGEYVYEEDEDGNMELGFVGVPQAYRGLFLIDREGVVRHQVVNDTPLGRNIDEAIRMVDALHQYQEFGEFCPAYSTPSNDAVATSAEGVAG